MIDACLHEQQLQWGEHYETSAQEDWSYDNYYSTEGTAHAPDNYADGDTTQQGNTIELLLVMSRIILGREEWFSFGKKQTHTHTHNVPW